MSAARGPIPTADEVLQNAGAFGAHLGFGSIAGYAAGKAMRAGTNIGLVLAGAGSGEGQRADGVLGGGGAAPEAADAARRDLEPDLVEGADQFGEGMPH